MNHSYATVGQMPGDPRSAVTANARGSVLAELREGLDQQEKLLHSMEERLLPVLRHSMPSGPGEDNKCTPASNDLQSARDAVHRCNAILGSLINRLDI